MDDSVRAPEFPAGYAWINTDRPLRFAHELKGRIVLLDFWTYCCINCMHVLAELKWLEEKYKNDPVVVIGVHSAKFVNEADTENVRAAVKRYGIEHPVIVDQRMRIWSSYAIRAWPSLVLIGPDGKVVGGVSGEGHAKTVASVIDQLLAKGRARGTVTQEKIELKTEEKFSGRALSFPGKVLVDEKGGRLFVADSNHNRIVVTGLPDEKGRAKLIDVIGEGNEGSADGAYDAATFFRPQGVAIAGETLWVADTENHLVRAVDLKKKIVRTVLGTGKHVFDPEAGKSGREQGLNSPWDVAADGNRLYISMAGQHQIFVINTLTYMAEILAGSGRESLMDDLAKEANLAQPSGMALDTESRRLYFADSEVSAVRFVDLKEGRVETIVGTGLFDFGDADGEFGVAVLQHCLGVATWHGGVLVADSYNHKIKWIDLRGKVIQTVAGGDGLFFEPASVAAAGERIFVADTNHHRVMMRTESGEWKEMVIEGLNAPACAGGVCVPDV